MSQLNGQLVNGDCLISEAISQTLSAGNASASVDIPMQGFRGVSLIETFNGDAVHTLVADLKIEIAHFYDPRNPASARFGQINDPTILAYLTTAYVDPVTGGGKPNGAAGASALQIDPLVCNVMRFTVTRTAGTGLYILDVKLSGNGRR